MTHPNGLSYKKNWGHVVPSVHVVTDILPGYLDQLLVNVQPDDPLGIVLTAQRDRHVTCSKNNSTVVMKATRKLLQKLNFKRKTQLFILPQNYFNANSIM